MPNQTGNYESGNGPRFRPHFGRRGRGSNADGVLGDGESGSGQPATDPRGDDPRGDGPRGDGAPIADAGLPPIREYVTEEEWHARRQPRPVDEILGRIMTDVGGGGGATAAMLEARWSEVVGPDFAVRSRPGSCRSGNLTVLVADGATASKMRFATAEILENAAQILGERAISAIAFRVRPGLTR